MNRITDTEIRGDWIQTYSGIQFFPRAPRIEDIRILDIAAALSKLCRYGGHTKWFYSVAQHSCLVHDAAATDKKDALLHDAAEAYVLDLPAPIKAMLPFYKAIEDHIFYVIAMRFDLFAETPKHIKEIDQRILLDERRCLMSEPPAPWAATQGLEPLGCDIFPWSPQRAFAEFKRRYEACT